MRRRSHQRGHELSGRDIECRVQARRARDGQPFAAGLPDLVRAALLDLNLIPRGGGLVDRRGRADDYEGDRRRVRRERETVRPDLVGDVAVRGHAITSEDRRVDRSRS